MRRRVFTREQKLAMLQEVEEDGEPGAQSRVAKKHGIDPSLLSQWKKPGRTVHRGVSKDGRRPLSVQLTDEEHAAFSKVAELECRSASGHARWLILQTIGGEKKP